MGTRNAYVMAGAAVLTVMAGAYGIHLWKASKNRQAFAFNTAKVERGSLVAKVTATGTLSAIVTVQVGSQVSGTITALYADFNSTVRKGELIARIDPRLYETAAQQSRANLTAAEGNPAKAAVAASAQALENAGELLRLAEGRYNAGVGSIIELGDAQVAYTSAAQQQVQSEYSLAQARAGLLRALGRPWRPSDEE